MIVKRSKTIKILQKVKPKKELGFHEDQRLLSNGLPLASRGHRTVWKVGGESDLFVVNLKGSQGESLGEHFEIGIGIPIV